jgi:uncharacterized membrane protein YcaP (DUF421 family)
LDFFRGQEALTTMEWVLRTVIAYFILLILAKVMGQRAISQLRLLDFVIALMLGNIIAHPLSDQTIGMKGSIISTIALVALYMGGVFLSLKWVGFRKVVDSVAFPLINKGEISYQGLKRARISIEDLLAELRKEKVEDVKKVALALWESDGKISIFLDPQYQPITPATYQMQTEPFDLPKTIISDGKINYQVLKEINKEEGWVRHNLKSLHQTEVQNVLLATIDTKDKIQVFLYK